MLWTVAFWKGAAERGVKTFAQTLAAYFVIGTTGLLDLDWGTALSVSGAAALASLLTSIGNADFVAGLDRPVEGGAAYPVGAAWPGAHRDDDGDGIADGE